VTLVHSPASLPLRFLKALVSKSSARSIPLVVAVWLLGSVVFIGYHMWYNIPSGDYDTHTEDRIEGLR
jgi:hypothetical protein